MANSHYDIESILGSQDVNYYRLTLTSEIKPFDCGHKELNEFLFKDSKENLKHLRYTTFVFETSERTMAYFSLANDLLRICDSVEDFHEENATTIDRIGCSYYEEFMSNTVFPAVKIGRLAVDCDFQSKGLGTRIIDSIVTSFLSENKTGCQFITLDALNCQRALAFYERNGFNYLTLNDCGKESRQMYKSLLDFI